MGKAKKHSRKYSSRDTNLWSKHLMVYTIDNTKASAKPVSFDALSKQFKEEHPDCIKAAGSLMQTVNQRMQNTERLQYLNLAEIVQLLYVLKQPVNQQLENRLRKENWELELDSKRKIRSFCSPDKTFQRSIKKANKAEVPGRSTNECCKKKAGTVSPRTTRRNSRNQNATSSNPRGVRGVRRNDPVQINRMGQAVASGGPPTANVEDPGRRGRGNNARNIGTTGNVIPLINGRQLRNRVVPQVRAASEDGVADQVDEQQPEDRIDDPQPDHQVAEQQPVDQIAGPQPAGINGPEPARQEIKQELVEIENPEPERAIKEEPMEVGGENLPPAANNEPAREGPIQVQQELPQAENPAPERAIKEEPAEAHEMGGVEQQVPQREIKQENVD